MKHFTFTALLLCGVYSLFAQDNSAVAIMTAVRNRINADTVFTRSRMVITRSGSTSERVIEQISKDDPNGNSRTVIVFISPANVAGSRFLTIDNSSGGSDRWIFLPELGDRVRRIAASDSGGSFMGTDFSYDDISLIDRNVGLDTHTLLREETINGIACSVIQSVPNESGYSYSKTISWIGKQNNLIYKSELYDRRGTQVKLLEILEYREIQGRLTPMQMKVSTLANGSNTTIYIDRIEYDRPISESFFTTRFLLTGRP
jgi:hypothetical protein